LAKQSIQLKAQGKILFHGAPSLRVSHRYGTRWEPSLTLSPIQKYFSLFLLRKKNNHDDGALKKILSRLKNSRRIMMKILNNRELQIITFKAQGLTAKEIARLIGLEHRTIEIYISRLIKKLEAKNIANAIYIATQKNIIREN